ncbi:hypothetical protein [Paenibacillus donghaensis]|uniref:Uncharacterized protein n=1 Tax=Paenibacillus donghaensis TaxID=414771 RepID=A0A2Z2KP30_9BACL|nr:hypothetical protein [Paenibacillus donghaensis]ASA25460.1 hypothetical protein B9T62_34860 [Paenibacillus donghaensis]
MEIFPISYAIIEIIWKEVSRIKPPVPFIQSKRSFVLVLGLLALFIVLFIRYPGPDPWIDVWMRSIGLPLYSRPETESGLQYSGILAAVLLIFLFTNFTLAFSRHRFILFFVIIILIAQTPGWLTTGYQRLFASGVYALKLDPQQVRCSYAYLKDNYEGNCSLQMTNHSSQPVTVDAVLERPSYTRHPLSTRPITLSGLVLQPRTLNSFNATFTLPATGAEGDNGNINGFVITLSDGSNSRSWK